jgi:hypothetical protein
MSASLYHSPSLLFAYDVDGKIMQRIMDYINSGTQQGITLHLGGDVMGQRATVLDPADDLR